MFFALAGAIFLWACENPYIVHNLIRPVTATAIEFHTDKDGSDTTPYALKPVFASAVTNYEVYVHEQAEIVYPSAYPETGSSVQFGSGFYTGGDGQRVTVPFVNGGYAFPREVQKMTVSFTVYKDYRINGVYTVQVIRRPDPGRMKGLKVFAAYYEGATPADPADGGWIYEMADDKNLMKGFDSTGSSYTVTLPYYTDKVVLTPEFDNPGNNQTVLVGYSLYPRDPQYYPDEHRDIGFNESASPQYFDFAGSRDPFYGYEAPHLYTERHAGQRISYLIIHTVVEDQDTHEQRYPQDFQIKLVWEKSLAYLDNLNIADDVAASEERLLGSFSMANTGYEAEVDPLTTKVTVKFPPRDADSIVTAQQYTAMGGQPLGSLRTFDGAIDSDETVPYTAEFALPHPARPDVTKSTTIQFTVTNPTKFTDPNDNNGLITYWLDLRRTEPFTNLINFSVEGWIPSESGADKWRPLLLFDDNDDDRKGVDVIASAWATLKEPSPPSPYELGAASNAADNVYSFTLEVDGSKVSKLRMKGFMDPLAQNGSAAYTVGDNAAAPDQETNGFEFNGSTGASITAKETDRKDRVYGFTFIRAGALSIETWTDRREAATNGAAAVTQFNPATDPRLINDDERGTFQAIVNSKAANNALPGQEVTIQVTPKLGWAVDKLYLTDSDGLITQELNSAWTPYYSSGPSPIAYSDATAWKFTMPGTAVYLLLTYKLSAGQISGAAYAAPEGKASRTGAYGTNAKGLYPGEADENGVVQVDPDHGPFNTGTSWAYATSNLQGLINKFDGVNFKEIWLLDGTYRLEPGIAEVTALDKLVTESYLHPNAANYRTTVLSRWWAEEIVAANRDAAGQNRSFVLRKGLRIYGGFKGTEGNANPAMLTSAREDRDESEAAARRTILSGSLRGSVRARHVVVAANIKEPTGSLTNTADFSTDYNHDPFGTDLYPGAFDGYSGDGRVTLLDTVTIRDGIRTKPPNDPAVTPTPSGTAPAGITINTEPVDMRYGAGLYIVDASPYLRNVIISNNTAVNGAGAFSYGANSFPVLKNVTFSNNDATGYNQQGGDGGGFVNSTGSTAVLLDCQFANNATIGGDGAGFNAMGGKTLLRRAEFRYNNAAAGGGLANSGDTWVYDSVFRNNDSVDGGSAIVQNGSLYLVNVTVKNNTTGAAVSNSGTLTATNLTVTANSGGGISSGGSLSLVNSRINNNGTGLSVGGGAVVTNTVIDGNSTTGVSYEMGLGAKDGSLANGPSLSGCILTNVTITGGGTGIDASFGSSSDFHTGAASLLLNSVRISGAGTGMSVGYSGAYPESRKGIHVTLNNVTITGNGTGLSVSDPDSLGTLTELTSSKGQQYREYDVLDLRIRNTVILGNTTNVAAITEVTTHRNRTITMGSPAGNFSAAPSIANTLYLSPEKALHLNVGDTFRFTNGGNRAADFRPSVNVVTGKAQESITTITTVPPVTPTPSKKVYKITFTTAATDNAAVVNYAKGDYLIPSGHTGLGTIGAAGSLSVTAGSSYTWKLTPAQAALLPVNTVFRIKSAGGTLKNSVNKVTACVPATGAVTFTAYNTDTYTAADTIVTSTGREGLGILGSRTKAGNNTWNLPAAAARIQANLDAAKAANGGTDTDIVFRLAAWEGGTEKLKAPSYTVPHTTGVNGTSVTFSAGAADPFTQYDRIMLANGSLSGVTTATMVNGPNTWTFPDAQAAQLTAGTAFRLITTGGTFRPSTYTVTAVADGGTPGYKDVTFSSAVADTFATADAVWIDAGAIGSAIANGNVYDGSRTIPASSVTLTLPLPGQAALFTQGETYRIVNGMTSAADGTLRAPVFTVTAVSAANNTITFSSSAAYALYNPGDYFVLDVANDYQYLPGNITWLTSQAGGVTDKMVKAGPAWPSAVTDFSLANLPAGGSMSGFRVGGSGTGGTSGTYPTSAADLVNQCFAGVDASDGYSGASAGLKSAMESLFTNNLFTWEGSNIWPTGADPSPPAIGSVPPGGVLTHRTIDYFLIKDNGFNVGDLRELYRVIDGTAAARTDKIGAYE
jgi:hypothetical protein